MIQSDAVGEDDAGDLHTDADPCGPGSAENFGCRWGCAIFQLRKL